MRSSSTHSATEWVYFRRLSDNGGRAAIRYRLRDQWAELVLHRARTLEEELRRCHREDPIP
ncbi:MAG: hypothetical protein ACOCVZ_09595, partial [Gemmatimonadota bacterium]